MLTVLCIVVYEIWNFLWCIYTPFGSSGPKKIKNKIWDTQLVMGCHNFVTILFHNWEVFKKIASVISVNFFHDYHQWQWLNFCSFRDLIDVALVCEDSPSLFLSYRMLSVLTAMLKPEHNKRHVIDAGSKQSPVSIKFLVRLRDLNNFLVI